jgi:hypothetical protein
LERNQSVRDKLGVQKTVGETEHYQQSWLQQLTAQNGQKQDIEAGTSIKTVMEEK